MRKLVLVPFWVLLAVSSVSAQSVCTSGVFEIFSGAQEVCAEVEDLALCVGSAPVTIFADGAPSRVEVGDMRALQTVERVITATSEVEYGVARFELRPYAHPAGATMVLFGNAQLDDAGLSSRDLVAVPASVDTAAGVNVRAGPSTEFVVLTPLFDGEALLLTGRDAANEWFRLQLADGRAGWVSAASVSVEGGAIDELAVVSLDDAMSGPLFAPFTAFQLTADTPSGCDAMPESGLLLQTSGDEAQSFELNGLPLSLQGTAYITAAEGVPAVYVLQGSAVYNRIEIEAGEWLPVRRNAETDLFDFPQSALPYRQSELGRLPLGLLPTEVLIEVDLRTIITPAPTIDRSPIIDMLVTDPCVITVGERGAFLRSGPGTEFASRGSMTYRQTARPIARTLGRDGLPWYQLGVQLWVSATVTVTGGDCGALPESSFP